MYVTKKVLIAVIFLSVTALYLSEANSIRRKLPCTHPLRNIVPYLFTHCNCTYSEWSEWEVVSGTTRRVATSQCRSGEAYTESRKRNATRDSCNNVTETRKVCKLAKSCVHACTMLSMVKINATCIPVVVYTVFILNIFFAYRYA